MSDSLNRLLFEDLSLLLLAEVVALAVVLAVHRRWMTPRSRRLVWLTLALSAALIGLQRAVVTDREALRAMVQTMAQAVEEGDVASLAEHFDDQMTMDHRAGKEAVVQYAYQSLQRYDITQARVSNFLIEVDQGSAKVRFQARGDVRGGSGEGFGTALLVWDLECRKTDETWKVLKAKYEFGIKGLGR